METKFFLTHLIGRNLWWILVSEDVGDFEKTQVEEDLSFPPLEVGSLKAKGLVEINFVTGADLLWFKTDSFSFLIPLPFTSPLHTYLAQYLSQFILVH